MRGDSKFITDLLGRQYGVWRIPIYQRPYSWQEEQCRRLFEDIERLARDHGERHFIGGVVTSPQGRDDCDVIDGQQRITTITLLCLALAESCDDPRLRDDIMATVTDRSGQPKLQPRNGDMDALRALVEHDTDNMDENSRLVQNHDLFRQLVESSDQSVEQLWRATRGLQIIDILTEPGDDAQTIFDSLNSTGLDLNESDRVRNGVLIGLPQEQQERLYKKYWLPMEHRMPDMDAYLRAWIIHKNGKTPRKGRLHTAVLDHRGNDPEALLSDLAQGADDLYNITGEHTGSPSIDQALTGFGHLKAKAAWPFLLDLMTRRRMGLSDEDTANAIGMLMSFLLRRMVCDNSLRSLNSALASLDGQVMRIADDNLDRYVDAMAWLMTDAQSENLRIPDDAEFRKAILERDMFRMGSEWREYLWDRLENADSKERVDVAGGLHDGSITIEHILPQKPNAEWKRSLGANWTDVHRRWANTVANLTITGYNSELSNRAFDEKRKLYAESPYRLTRELGGLESWGEPELSARADRMVERFLELWPYPSTSFVPPEMIRARHSLDEAFDFTGWTPLCWTFDRTRHTAGTWAECLVGILGMLSDRLRPYVGEFDVLSDAEQTDGQWRRAGDGLWVNTGNSTRVKIDLLLQVCERLGIRPARFRFDVRMANRR